MSRSATGEGLVIGKGLGTGMVRVLAFGFTSALVVLGWAFLIMEPVQAAFPGKNGKVVFVSNRLTPDNPIPEGRTVPDFEIFVSSASGAGVVQLTYNNWNDFEPAFSHDGRKIVFTHEREGDADIFVMSASGAGQRDLTPDGLTGAPALDEDPAFSPSGKKIVFVSTRDTGGGVINPDKDREIFTMNPDGTGLRQLTRNAPREDNFGANDQDPVFSPSGKKIAFTNDRDQMVGEENTEIYTMDASGANEVNLSRNPARDVRPDWSPDGRRIVFSSFRDSVSTAEIYAINADGSNSRRLTANNVADGSPVFSPDGRQVAFHSFRDGNLEIHRMKTDGSQQTMVTNILTGENAQPDWQPLQPRR